MKQRRIVFNENAKAIFGATIIGIITIITRTALLKIQNAYTDYDEGTYLLFARYINHGILPYRDIFAVHPPLYYYLLAVWMKVFGDSYISGRLLSLVLGVLSLIVAYHLGRELKGWKLGLIFAGILALDPIFIQINSLVFHESFIELMTLLSIYYFVRYYKTTKSVYAYTSIAWAALGTTAKFTMIPFLLALYISLLMVHSEDIEQYYLSTARIILSSKQILLAAFVFVTAIIVSIAAISAWPVETSRLLFIVPGIHEIKKIGHVYASVVFIFFWALMILYVFNVSYVHQVLRTIKTLVKKWKFALSLASVVIIVKALIEVPLGILVSSDYISQTYLAQSGRGFPFITGFVIMNKILSAVQNDSADIVIQWTVSLLLIALLILFSLKWKGLKINRGLNILFLNTAFLYILVFPMLPGPRYLLPAILTGYLVALYALFSSGIPSKKATNIIIISILILGLASYGMSHNYPRGSLKFAFAPHTQEMRDDLKDYIETYGTPGLCLPVNPMNTYYLHLESDPWLLDTFGIVYLKKESGRYLLKEAINRGVNCTILDSWMYAIKGRDSVLLRAYGTFENYTILNGTLLFGGSFYNGEVLEMFEWKRPNSTLRITTSKGALLITYDLMPLLKLAGGNNNTQDTHRVTIEYINGMYRVRWEDSNGHRYYATLVYTPSGLVIHSQNVSVFKVSFSGIALAENGTPLMREKNYTYTKVCTQSVCVGITGESIRLEGKNKILISGSAIKIEVIPSNQR